MGQLPCAHTEIRRPNAIDLGPDFVVHDQVTEHHFDLIACEEPTGARWIVSIFDWCFCLENN